MAADTPIPTQAAPQQPAAPTPGPAAQASPAPTSTPVVSAPSTPAPVAESSPEWNGEMESLAKESWWKEVPDTIRPNLERGLRAKHANWQSGYQKRLAEADTAKKAAEQARTTAASTVRAELQAEIQAANTRATEAERRAKLYTEWYGPSSTQAQNATAVSDEATKELEELRAYRTQAESEREAWGKTRAELEKERDEHKTWRSAREEQDIRDQANAYVVANKDILDDDDAAAILERLIDKEGVDADDAANKVRALMQRAGAAPSAKAPAAAKAPARDPLDVMDPGDSRPGGFSPRETQEMANRGVNSNDIWAAAERAVRLHNTRRA